MDLFIIFKAFGLGFLSTISFGCHTFTLWLLPLTIQTTLEESSDSTLTIFWNVWSKIFSIVFLFGFGTSIGELPPFVLARITRLNQDKLNTNPTFDTLHSVDKVDAVSIKAKDAKNGTNGQTTSHSNEEYVTNRKNENQTNNTISNILKKKHVTCIEKNCTIYSDLPYPCCDKETSSCDISKTKSDMVVSSPKRLNDSVCELEEYIEEPIQAIHLNNSCDIRHDKKTFSTALMDTSFGQDSELDMQIDDDTNCMTAIEHESKIKQVTQIELETKIEESPTIELGPKVQIVQTIKKDCLNTETIHRDSSEEKMDTVASKNRLLFSYQGLIHSMESFSTSHQFITFFLILILASIPNPLFDMTGMLCGYTLMPAHIFLSATIIGKTFFKMGIQISILILIFSTPGLKLIVEYSERYLSSWLSKLIVEFIHDQKKNIGIQNESGGSWLSIGTLCNIIMIIMILLFVYNTFNAIQKHISSNTKGSIFSWQFWYTFMSEESDIEGLVEDEN